MTATDDHNGVARGEVDWSTAQVADAVLTVELTGEPSPAWRQRLEGLIELLQRTGSGWDRITVTKSRLKVTALTEGCEVDLRHFVESAVQQANADFAAQDDNDEDPSEGDESVHDDEMTAAFRAFATDAGEGPAKAKASSNGAAAAKPLGGSGSTRK